MSHAPMTLRFSALGLRGSATANQTFTPCTYQFNNLFRFLPASCGLLTRRAYTFGSPKSVTDQGRRRWTSNRLVQAEAASRYLGPTSWSRSNSTSPSDFGELTQEAWKTHPDRFKPLTMQEISRIFGPGLSLQLGNDLLRMIQMHRITGTLDHEIELDGIDEGHIAKGLSWLRSIYPLDEDTAIMKRIEAEEKLMEEEFRKTAKDGLNYTPQASAENGGVYGKSRFDEIMEATKAKAEAQATEEKAEKDNPSVETSKIERPADRAVLKRRKESAQWVQAYKEKARLSKLEEPPEMSKTARLFPATIFTIVCVGLCLLFAQNYQPPVRHARLFPDLPPAAATVLAIISVNVVILACWKIPPFWRVMNTYFLLIPATPNHLSVLGNAFSHHGIGHFFSNMAFLWFVGTRLHDEIGRGNFLALYLAGGVIASYSSLLRCVLMHSLKSSTLGASGAVLALVAAHLSLHSGDVYRFAFLSSDISPIFSPILLLIAILTIEVVGISRGVKKIDHYAHLGGFFTGIASAEALKYKTRNRRKELGQNGGQEASKPSKVVTVP